MQLDPKSLNLLSLFPVQSNIIYNVPIYQRNYSWKNQNIETLFYDIKNEDKGYYIGNLLVTPNEINKETLDIVDGQQRITTISLFLLGIYFYLLKYRNNIEEIKDNDFSDKLTMHRADIGRQLVTSNNLSRIHLLNEDDEIYNDLLKIIREKSDKYKPYKNRIFGKRFQFILDLIQEEFFKEDDTRTNINNLIKFYEKVNNVEILQITVNNLMDAFSIFTSFNAKGLPLTLIDLLKSYYLKVATNDIGDEYALTKWENLLDYFKDDNNEPMSSLVTQFLQNYYDTYESGGNSSITKNRALHAYEKLFDKHKEPYIDDLTKKALIFSSFTNDIENSSNEIVYNSRINNLLNKLSKLEVTSAYPLILYILNQLYEKQISDLQVEEILSYLVNYYVRRNLILRPKSSNLRAKVLYSVRQLEEIDEYTKDKDPVTIIKNILNELAASDEDFESILRNGDIYEINSVTTRMVLIDLERNKGNYFNKQIIDNLDEKNKNGNYIRTLEHIMPQKLSNNSKWYKILGTDDISEEEVDLIHYKNVHKLGNLTLTGYNSELSNSDFIQKRDYIDPKTKVPVGLMTPLFLNSSIASEDELLDKKEEWSIVDIDRRTKYLAQLAKDNYPIF